MHDRSLCCRHCAGLTHIKPQRRYAGTLDVHHFGDDMNSVQTFIRQVERDAALIEAMVHVLASIRLIHRGQIRIEHTELVIDLTDDIQRLTAALVLMGHT